VTVIVTGPAGAGKTTVGRQLAHDLAWPFLDADDLHTAEAIGRMRRGGGLTDADREPCLRRVRDAIVETVDRAGHVVVACSALKARYRATLSTGVPDVRWIYLDADEALLRRRLTAREGHFAGPALLASQLADLEPPHDALVLPAALPVADLVARIRSAIDAA
jgi:gluconokinase